MIGLAWHHCRYHGCNVLVKAIKWGCDRHWFTLPKRLRNKILRARRTCEAQYRFETDIADQWSRELERIRSNVFAISNELGFSLLDVGQAFCVQRPRR